MDRQTLNAVSEWLDALEEQAALAVERLYTDETTLQQTAYRAGKAAGIRDAKAWIERCARLAVGSE